MSYFLKKSPIGVFDSGVGGLTVFSEIRRVLPLENIVYLGDTARVPYGAKSAEVIKRYSKINVDLLISAGVKAVVVACNTASATALSYLKSSFKNLLIIGVIEPVTEYLLAQPKLKKVAIIGTATTIASNSYQKALQKNPNIQIFTKSCPLFVPLVEEGLFNHQITNLTIEMYLSAVKKESVDALVLGCTHYPMLKSAIFDYFDGKIEIIDAALYTAKKLSKILKERDLANAVGGGSDKFLVTDDPRLFQKTAELFLGYRPLSVYSV